jgi:hypothetical protein
MSTGSVCRHLKIVGRVAIFTILSRCQQEPTEVATQPGRLTRSEGTTRHVCNADAIRTETLGIRTGMAFRPRHQPGEHVQDRRSLPRSPIANTPESFHFGKHADGDRVTVHSPQLVPHGNVRQSVYVYCGSSISTSTVSAEHPHPYETEAELTLLLVLSGCFSRFSGSFCRCVIRGT